MNDIKDVKPPVDLPDFWWLFLSALVFIAAGAVLYFLLRCRRLARTPRAIQTPQLSAWDTAYQELDALSREDLPGKGLFKEFFTKVADIARRYMENRFDIRAPHMSTEEFLSFLETSGHLDETHKAALKDFLNSCDMVKFAQYAPTIAEAVRNFDLAKRLVDDTRV